MIIKGILYYRQKCRRRFSRLTLNHAAAKDIMAYGCHQSPQISCIVYQKHRVWNTKYLCNLHRNTVSSFTGTFTDSLHDWNTLPRISGIFKFFLCYNEQRIQNFWHIDKISVGPNTPRSPELLERPQKLFTNNNTVSRISGKHKNFSSDKDTLCRISGNRAPSFQNLWKSHTHYPDFLECWQKRCKFKRPFPDLLILLAYLVECLLRTYKIYTSLMSVTLTWRPENSCPDFLEYQQNFCKTKSFFPDFLECRYNVINVNGWINKSWLRRNAMNKATMITTKTHQFKPMRNAEHFITTTSNSASSVQWKKNHGPLRCFARVVSATTSDCFVVSINGASVRHLTTVVYAFLDVTRRKWKRKHSRRNSYRCNTATGVHSHCNCRLFTDYAYGSVDSSVYITERNLR